MAAAATRSTPPVTRKIAVTQEVTCQPVGPSGHERFLQGTIWPLRPGDRRLLRDWRGDGPAAGRSGAFTGAGGATARAAGGAGEGARGRRSARGGGRSGARGVARDLARS